MVGDYRVWWQKCPSWLTGEVSLEVTLLSRGRDLLVGDVCHGASPHEVPGAVRHAHHGSHHGRPVLVLETVVGVDPGLRHGRGGEALLALHHHFPDVRAGRAEVGGLDLFQLGAGLG